MTDEQWGELRDKLAERIAEAVMEVIEDLNLDDEEEFETAFPRGQAN